MDELIQRALKAKRESKYIDFKESLDLSDSRGWCEVIKDIAAIANSGGGVILIGADNKGTPTGIDPTPILELDLAIIADKIYKYTNVHFSDIEISEHHKGRHKLAAIRVHPISIPFVFTKPGTYKIEEKKQKTAFSVGTVYFRHGAKSEPGTSNDIRKVIERQLDSIRKSWVKGLRKVVHAPAGSQVVALPPGTEVVETKSPKGTPIRFTDDPNAPTYRKIDPDVTHPYRQKELVDVINRKLKGKYKVNSYDIQVIKLIYKIGEKEEFSHSPKFATTQYSDLFANWVVTMFQKDDKFFEKTRQEAYKRKH